MSNSLFSKVDNAVIEETKCHVPSWKYSERDPRSLIFKYTYSFPEAVMQTTSLKKISCNLFGFADNKPIQQS